MDGVDGVDGLFVRLGERGVIVASANFRDLGGLRTLDGYATRYGRLFRSGHLHELNPAERLRVESLNLSTIVDLRRPSEVETRPTPTFGTERNTNIAPSAGADEFAEIAAIALEPAKAEHAASLAVKYYRENVLSRLDLYRPVVREAIDPDNHPLLFHCTAGKDRTGFVAAVLLGLLGVDRPHVIRDYLATNELRREWMAQHLMNHRRRVAEQRGVDVMEVSEADLATTRIVLIAEAVYIEASLDAVEERFGTWDAFRTSGLGISDSELDRFHKSMLH